MLLKLQSLLAFIVLTVFCLCCKEEIEEPIPTCGEFVGITATPPPATIDYHLTVFSAAGDCVELGVAGPVCPLGFPHMELIIIDNNPPLQDSLELVLRVNVNPDTCMGEGQFTQLFEAPGLRVGENSTTLVFPELDTALIYNY